MMPALFFPLVLCGQYSHQIFEHLTVEDGISSNKVTGVIQDKEGFYWIATQNGLNRFDGSSFTQYYHLPGDSTSLPHNFCTAILQDFQGRIWITTYGGVCRYDKVSGTFKTITLPGSQYTTQGHLRLTNLSTDGETTMWVMGNGIWRIDLSTDKIEYMKAEEQNPYAPSLFDFSRNIVYDTLRQGWWMALGDGLNFYDRQSRQFYKRSHNPKGWKIFDSAMPGAITLDDRSRLWFVDRMEKNLAVFDVNENTIRLNQKELSWHIMELQSDPDGRIWIFYWSDNSEIYVPETNQTITDFFQIDHDHSMLTSLADGIFIDQSGSTWIYSGEGISIYNPRNQYYKLYPYDLTPFKDKSAIATVYAIAQTQPNTIWMGTDLGLFEYDLRTGHMLRLPVRGPSKISKKEELPYKSSAVTTLTAVDHQLFLGIQDQLIRYNTSTRKTESQISLLPNVQFIRKEPQGILWAGTWSNGLFSIDPVTGTKKHFIAGDQKETSLRTNSLIAGYMENDTLWIGYNGGHGFAGVDLKTRSVTHYLPSFEGATSYAQGTITALAKAEGRLWLGTYGGGLVEYDPSVNTYHLYQQEAGLKSNYIHSLFSDHQKRLWISTADGLCLFDIITKQILPLEFDSSFPDNDYVDSGCRGVDGKLYFFQRDKIFEIDPVKFISDTTYPRLVISTFRIFDEENALPPETESIRLRHNQNFFSFSFSAIRTQPQVLVRYAYQLEGFDPDWVETTSTYAGYTNVPPGEYRFLIRLQNDVGQWSAPLLSREIIITPPFWKTAWFIALIMLGVACILYALHRYRIRQIKKIYSIRTQISRDLHDDIGASLSSIHIYSTIAEEEIQHDPEKAKTFLQQINVNSRQVMEDISDIVWANRLQHEHHASLDARIKNYGYDLLSQKNMACTYRIDPEAEQRVTNPETRRNILMIIKEALNNMAKYSEASHAEIELFLKGNDLWLRISDNGCGFNPEQRNGGNGLEHMRKRAEDLGGSLTITSQPGKGTMILCQIPVTRISDK